MKMNKSVGNILRSKFCACCCILLSSTRSKCRCTYAYLQRCFRCHWCRNLAVVNCTVHWIALTLSTLQIAITLVILVA